MMVKFEQVTKKFGEITALRDVSFEVGDGEFVFIMGPSGAGKTTIIRLILAGIKPTSGNILIGSKNISKIKKGSIPKLRQKIGVVFQDNKIMSDRTARENIDVALAVIGKKEKDWKSYTDRVLELVGIKDRADMFPSQLSGGELQRVTLARALVVNPNIILADEPTGNLDWKRAEEIADLLEKINKEGKTIIMATHHERIVSKLKKRIIKLDKGEIVKE